MITCDEIYDEYEQFKNSSQDLKEIFEHPIFFRIK